MSIRSSILVYSLVGLCIVGDGCIPLVPEPRFAWHSFQVSINPNNEKDGEWIDEEVELIRRALAKAAERLNLGEREKPRTRGRFCEHAAPECVARYERHPFSGPKLLLEAWYSPHKGHTGTISIVFLELTTAQITDTDILRSESIWKELHDSLYNVFGERLTDRKEDIKLKP